MNSFENLLCFKSGYFDSQLLIASIPYIYIYIYIYHIVYIKLYIYIILYM